MKNRVWQIFIILIPVITIMIIGCSKNGSNPTQTNMSGNMQGKVTSQTDGSAISGASIQTNPVTSVVYSDQSGNFSINGIAQGVYIVTALKTGFQNHSLNVSITSGKTTTVNFQLAEPDTIPAGVILLSPGNDSSNVPIPPTLSWIPSSGASSYSLQVSIHSSFDTLIVNGSGLTKTSYPIGGLSLSTTYYWRVSATNQYGTSNWSAPSWSFTTSNIYGIPCPGIPTVTYEGKVYNTVQIGSQCWLRENLDVGSMIYNLSNQTNNNQIEKYCYNNNPANCDTYGGLYQWDEAMQYVNTEKAQGICPSGWHLPTLSEISTLRASIHNDGNSLKDVSQGSGIGTGTNTSGFSALLAGSGSSSGFSSIGDNTSFWGSTQYDISTALALYLTSYDGSIAFSYFSKTSAFSVRCVKN
ncbi:MAG: FISUMP domain-containing protein [Ignavibacteriaceae bacterium]